MIFLRALASTLLLFFVAACGGNVVFVADGGEGGSTSTSTTDTSSSTTTTGSVCDVLRANLEAALTAASACNPNLSIPQCDGSATLNDKCGCPSILANETNPDTVIAAQTAYDNWIQEGCGPLDCSACFPAGPGGCVPSDGGGGVCETVTPL